jgi:uncharacterized membrane protein
MNDGRRLMPSNSTTVGTIGGASLAPVIVWIINQFTTQPMPAEVAAPLGAFIGNFVGYFFEGGRKS